MCLCAWLAYFHAYIRTLSISRILVSARVGADLDVLYGFSGKAVRLFIVRARNPECQEASPRAHGARRRRPQSRGPGFVDFPFLTKGSVSTHYSGRKRNRFFLWRLGHWFARHDLNRQ